MMENHPESDTCGALYRHKSSHLPLEINGLYTAFLSNQIDTTPSNMDTQQVLSHIVVVLKGTAVLILLTTAGKPSIPLRNKTLKYKADANGTGLLWTYRNRAFRSSSSLNSSWISGPKGKALKGNVQELQTNGAASCKAWYSLYEWYGPAYELTIPFFRLHIINHPTYLEHIQKHNSKNYIRGSFTRNVFGALHRSGVFAVDGAEWQFQRKAATRAFSKRNFETHITASVHRWLDVLMELLGNLAREEKVFDFQEVMGRFLFCLFLQIAFHEEALALDLLSGNPASLDTKPDYIRAFDQATVCMFLMILFIVEVWLMLWQCLTDEEGILSGRLLKDSLARTKLLKERWISFMGRLTD